MRKFAKRLEELRKEKGLSYRQLGDAVGIAHTMILFWENGKHDITSDNLIKLAEYFNVSADYLLGLTD